MLLSTQGWLILLVFIPLAYGRASAVAQPIPTTGEIFVDEDTQRPRVTGAAASAGGDFTIVWSDTYLQEGVVKGRGVYARSYTADGSPRGEQFRVSPSGPDEQWGRGIEMDAEGDFIVVWEVQDSPNAKLWAQLYAPDGTTRGDTFHVAGTVTPSQRIAAPSVAMRTDGEFAVAWTICEGNNCDPTRLQAYTADGTPLSPAPYEGGPWIRFLEPDVNGGYLGCRYGRWCQRFAVDGMPMGEEFELDFQESVYWHALPHDLEVMADGTIIVVWHEYKLDDGEARYSPLYARRFTASGAPISDVITVEDTPRNHVPARIAAGGPGGIFGITFQCSANICIRRYDAAGVPIEPRAQVNEQCGPGSPSSLLMNDDGGLVVVWNSIGDVCARLYEDVAVPTEVGAEPEELMLGTPWPNPASENVEIPLSLSQPATIEVVVYDLLGREVTRTPETSFGAGSHALSIETHAFETGLYVVRTKVRLRDQLRYLTQRFTVVR